MTTTEENEIVHLPEGVELLRFGMANEGELYFSEYHHKYNSGHLYRGPSMNNDVAVVRLCPGYVEYDFFNVRNLERVVIATKPIEPTDITITVRRRLTNSYELNEMQDFGRALMHMAGNPTVTIETNEALAR